MCRACHALGCKDDQGPFPDTRIVLLSSNVHDHFIEEALTIGVSGYVVKTDTLVGVIEAICSAASRPEAIALRHI